MTNSRNYQGRQARKKKAKHQRMTHKREPKEFV